MMTNLKSLSILISALVCLSGCAEMAPRTEAELGDATRATLHAQIINPDAGNNPDTVGGIDGRAARDAVDSYQRSFADPAPRQTPDSVININSQQ